VLAGLCAPRKTRPPELFYDAHGAWLFTRICATQAYYPTRTETGILHQYAPQIAQVIGRRNPYDAATHKHARPNVAGAQANVQRLGILLADGCDHRVPG
jgi:hypothetical protein